MARLGCGPDGGRAKISPTFTSVKTSTAFTAAQVNTGLPLEFSRKQGHHRVYIKYFTNSDPGPGTPFIWSFALSGGTNRVVSSLNDNRAIDFRIASNDPPRGCSIVRIPAVGNTTRINQFRVIETVTGNALTFVFAYCPYFGITSTITYTSGPVLSGNGIIVETVAYRLVSEFRATGMDIAFGAPSYSIDQYATNFTSVLGVNPLDAGTPLPFSWVTGQSDVVVQNTTNPGQGFFFSFTVSYGIQGQAAGYPYGGPTTNAELEDNPENATLTSSLVLSPGCITTPIKFTFTTLAPDSRVYAFIFYPDGGAPTIQLVSGAPLGANNIQVSVYKPCFETV